MDEDIIRKLETKAYFALVRALFASNKLNFESEVLLIDLQAAFGIDDETSANILQQLEQDQDMMALKNFELSKPAATTNNMPSMQAAKPVAARPTPIQTYQPQESPFSQAPAAKKQKKVAGSLPPPTTVNRVASITASTPKPATQPVAKQRARPQPSTPQGPSPVTPQGGGIPQRASKGLRPTVSVATFKGIMQRGLPDEMEAYLSELNMREREIFTELISQGVDETEPELNELHRELLRWYKLDHRQSEIAQQLLLHGT